jgi:hypothetical protein
MTGAGVAGSKIVLPKDVPALAKGGIVRRPTLALIGEAGPEAVVPLSRLSAMPRSSTSDAPTLVIQSLTLQGVDGPSIRNLVTSGEFADALATEIRNNPRGLGTAVRRAVPA